MEESVQLLREVMLDNILVTVVIGNTEQQQEEMKAGGQVI